MPWWVSSLVENVIPRHFYRRFGLGELGVRGTGEVGPQAVEDLGVTGVTGVTCDQEDLFCSSLISQNSILDWSGSKLKCGSLDLSTQHAWNEMCAQCAQARENSRARDLAGL